MKGTLGCRIKDWASTSRNASRAGSSRAFVLRELFVVLGCLMILGLLGGVCVIGRAARLAAVSVDLENSRRILVAATCYVADHEDLLPSPGWGTSDRCWLHGANLPIITHDPIERELQREKVQEGQLWEYLQDLDVFVCPSESPTGLWVNQRFVKINSYAWNGAVNSYGLVRTPHKLSSFRPSAILQWEANETKPGYFMQSALFPDSVISQRHGVENAVNERLDVGGGGVVGTFGGAAYFMSYSNYVRLSGPVDRGGKGLKNVPNELWCDPRDPRGGALR